MRNALRLFLLAAAVGLFVWFVHRAGPGEIVKSLGTLGAQAPLVLLPYTAVHFLDTVGWRYAFHRSAQGVLSFPALARIRLIGEAINNVVPSAQMGGEPVKVFLARRRGAPVVEVATSVVVAKFTMTVAQACFIGLGTLSAARVVENPALSTAFTTVTALAFVGVALLFWLQRRGIFTGIVRLLAAVRIRLHELERRRETLERLDRQIAGFYTSQRRRFLASTAWHLAGWLAGVLEVVLVVRLAGHSITLEQALAVEAFSHVAKYAGAFVPGSLGIQESALVLLFRGLGMPDAVGVTYAILRRAREVFFALIGGGLLLAERVRPRDVREQVNA